MIVTKREMIALEKNTGLIEEELIKKAGFRCAKEIAKRTNLNHKILIFCGKGNNGQDGLELASHLSDWGYNIHVVLVFEQKTNIQRFQDKSSLILDLNSALNHLNEFDLIVDCIFGFSFHLPLSSDLSLLFNKINQSNVPVYSIDLNSGMEADTGRASDNTIKSKITFALGAHKVCHMLRKDHQCFDECVLIPLDFTPVKTLHEEMCHEKLKKLLPIKKEDSHKSQNGRCLIHAGSEGMAGAAALCLQGAAASGASYIRAYINQSIYAILAHHTISTVFHFKEKTNINELLLQCDAIVSGPGCTLDTLFEEAMYKLMDCSLPQVLDASALRWLSNHKNLIKKSKAPLILTPHLAEFSALCQKSISEIKQNKLDIMKEFVEEYPCILVLKGPCTVVMDPQGKIYINQTGNARLAKAGSGDVLAGLIGGFLAQHCDPFDAAMAAVWLHGKAADQSSHSPYGFLPEQITQEIEQILRF